MTFIFIITWFILFVWAVRTMSRGFNAISQERSVGMYTKTVTKPVHPEMVDVEPGTELMGVTFKEPEKDPRFKLDSPDLHNLDPLQKSLQDRINELNEDEDDDDDDGDIIVRI